MCYALGHMERVNDSPHVIQEGCGTARLIYRLQESRYCASSTRGTQLIK